MRQNPEIAKEEIELAAKGLPGKKAVGPDEFPAEVYEHCRATHQLIASLFGGMLERNSTPGGLRRFYVVPLDKACEDSAKCGSERPIAPPSPLMKL